MEILNTQYKNIASDIVIKDIVSVSHDIKTREWNYKRRPANHYEMHYIINGGIISKRDGITTTHDTDALLYNTPENTGASSPASLPTEIIAVYFTAEIPDVANNIFSDTFQIHNCVSDIRSSFRNIKHIYYSRKDNYQLKIKKELYDIFSVITDKLNEINQQKANYYTIRAAEMYIKERYLKEDISIEFLARLCKITPAYFSRVFKDVFGMSPKKYIISLKMQTAKEYLEYTMAPISEISKLTGYNELPYFTNTFKNHFGVSPSQYRKK